ncbi:MAG: ribonuclease E/G, partial [Kordiimonadaceae bacterium]|nr:ribonuclease E/G [Kordiimonadaceae bacterium]
PLYHRYQVESSLEAMYQPVVQLKSGGYIVINPTEALISIDVNSGRATKEHNIEETAVKTNLEAAEEVARQLRLRDMAGLVVIDFIDMEDRGNNRAVERKMKDMLKNDRARIQVGRISSFGLMEMSRQRLRPNLLEVAMETCATCAGTGIVRSVESASLMALRQLEEEGIRNRSHTVRISTNPDVAVYLLNKKRAVLSALEAQYDLIIEVLAQPTLGQSDIEITRETTVHAKAPLTADAVVTLESSAPDFNDTDDTDEKSEKSEKSEKEETNTPVAKADDDDEHPRKKRRRRRRRRRGGEDAENGDHRSNRQQNASSEEDTEETAGETRAENADDDTEDKPRSRRRRGTRGGRRRRSHNDAPTENRENGETVSAETVSTDHADEAPKAVGAQEGDAASQEGEAAGDDKKPTRRRRRIRRTSSDETPASAEASAPAEVHETATENAVEEKPKRRGRRKAADTETETSQAEKAGDTPKSDEKPKPRRRRAAKAVEKTAGVDSTVSVEAKDETAEKPKRRRRTTKAAVETTDAPKVSESSSPSAAEKPAKAKRAPRKSDAKPAEAKPAVKAAAKTAAEPVSAPKPKATLVESTGGEGKAGRKGWWQRTFG